jgi:hypothetical protein
VASRSDEDIADVDGCRWDVRELEVSIGTMPDIQAIVELIGSNMIQILKTDREEADQKRGVGARRGSASGNDVDTSTRRPKCPA